MSTEPVETEVNRCDASSPARANSAFHATTSNRPGRAVKHRLIDGVGLLGKPPRSARLTEICTRARELHRALFIFEVGGSP
jgi:hypothetical protein